MLSLVLALPALGLLVLGVYALSVADPPEYENGASSGVVALIDGLAIVALIGGLVVAAVAWAVYPRGSRSDTAGESRGSSHSGERPT